MPKYIDRELALSMPFANGHYDHENANEHYIFGCETYKEWLETLPTADVRENIHAKFVSEIVKKENWKGQMQSYYQPNSCSNCHTALMGKEKFCPNCGADMRERREDVSNC